MLGGWPLTDHRCNGATVVVAPGDGCYATPGRGVDETRIAYVLEESKLKAAISAGGGAVAQYPGRTSSPPPPHDPA